MKTLRIPISLIILVFPLFIYGQYDILTDYKIKGNVGVGTDTPLEKFQIGDRWTFHDEGWNFVGYNVFYDGQSDKRIFSGEGASEIRFGPNGEMLFWTAQPGEENKTINFNQSLAIQNNGNVGIEVFPPSEKLDVGGNLRVRNRLYIDGTDLTFGKEKNRALVHTNWGGKDNLVLNYKGDFEGGVQVIGPKMVVKGNLGLGEDNPLANLHIPNNGKFRLGPWEISQDGDNQFTSFLRIDRWLSNGLQKTFAFDWTGRFYAQKVKVLDIADFPDFVFEDDYNLLPLLEIEKYVLKNKHLPDIPSAKEVKEDGLDLGEMDTKLLQKIEELTLHTIDQHKQITSLKEENASLEERLEKIEKLLHVNDSKQGNK